MLPFTEYHVKMVDYLEIFTEMRRNTFCFKTVDNFKCTMSLTKMFYIGQHLTSMDIDSMRSDEIIHAIQKCENILLQIVRYLWYAVRAAFGQHHNTACHLIMREWMFWLDFDKWEPRHQQNRHTHKKSINISYHPNNMVIYIACK